eukprot:gene39201-biopygen13920
MAAGVGFRILGAAYNDHSGASVSGAGDVNGDGIDDVIVGAYSADPPRLAADSDAGIAYVVFGRNMTGSAAAFGDVDLFLVLASSTLGFRILGVGAGDQFGLAVNRAGDVNHDGIDDIIVGARFSDPIELVANSNAGVSYVIFGRKVTSPANAFQDIQLTNTSLPSSVGFRILGAAVNDLSGSSVSSAGDQSGNSVSYAGDVNGDGVDDIIIGSFYADPQPSKVDAGISYVIYGRRSSMGVNPFSDINLATLSLGSSVGFRILGAKANDQSGNCVSSAGDINGDGFDDVMIAAAVGDYCGRVSKAGDVNGDGVDDIIIGAQGADPAAGRGSAGISYVIFGRKVTSAANAFTDIQLTTIAMAAGVGFRILGAVTLDNSGISVSGAGDVNGDGVDDVIVGAYVADPPNLTANSDAGIAYVVFGRNMTGSALAFGDVELSAIVTGSTLGFRILGAVAGDQLGVWVSRAGDVNNDGVGDVVVGARFADPTEVSTISDGGISYVIFGRRVTSPANAFGDIYLTSSTLPSDISFRILGTKVNDYSGTCVSSAGDINGDGMDDIMVGAANADPPTLVGNSKAGITYVIYGRNVAGGAPAFADLFLSSIVAGSTIGFRVFGATYDDSSGYRVSNAGDVNGDGVNDIVIGALYADPQPSKADAGISYVIYGRKSIAGNNPFSDIDLATLSLGSSVGFRILGAAAQDRSGYGVSGAGDINGDGFDDVMVGTVAGPSYVIYGAPVSPTSQPSSQPSRQPTSQPTSVPSTQELSLSHLDTAQGFKMSLGSAVSSAGDLNGDGVDDVIVAAAWWNGNTGIAFVVFGSFDQIFDHIDFATRVTGPTTGFRILPAEQGGLFGYSVSKAGDVNGDGVDDVIIGAYASNPDVGRPSAGISYVIFGRKVTSLANAFTDIQLPTTAMASNVGFRILGAAVGDRSGSSVSGAGDINADGIDDLVIGAYFADPPSLAPGSNAGIVYIVFGKNMTGSAVAFGDVDLSQIVTGSTLGFRILGAAANDVLGLSVSRAGDVNHDGISDVIVGARNADPENLAANSNAGISYVIFGRRVTSPANAFGDIQLTSTSLPSDIGFRILGAAVIDISGVAVSGAGDINGDGIEDILVGALNADPPLSADSNAGITYVIFGRDILHGTAPFGDISLSAVTAGSSIGFRILGAKSGDNSGVSASNAGDVNGDGVDDIVVGAYTADPQPSKVDAASVGFRILGAATDDTSGYSVSGAGDMNGDGIDDVIVGAYAADPPILAAGSNAGIVYVVFGKNMTGSALAFGDVDLSLIVTGSTAGFRILGSATFDQLGASVSRAGDINND